MGLSKLEEDVHAHSTTLTCCFVRLCVLRVCGTRVQGGTFYEDLEGAHLKVLIPLAIMFVTRFIAVVVFWIVTVDIAANDSNRSLAHQGNNTNNNPFEDEHSGAYELFLVAFVAMFLNSVVGAAVAVINPLSLVASVNLEDGFEFG